MIKVLSVNVEDIANAGCNNGNYPHVTVCTSKRDYNGLTCACHRGCSNTWNIENIEGKEFANEEELLEYLFES